MISCCLIFAEPCPWLPDRQGWRLRSMATDATQRLGGAGTAVLRAAVSAAAGHGAEVLWCLARETATGCYRRNGWLENGSLFDTDSIPHLRMWRELADREPAVAHGPN